MISINKTQAGVLFALVTATSLGSITTQAKIFYADGGNAMTLIFTRFLVSTIVFGLLITIRRKTFAIEPAQRIPTLLLGSVWSGAMIFYLLSVQSISVSLAVLTLYVYPLLVLAYALLCKQLSASVNLILLFVLAFLGLYLALSGGELKLDVTGLVFASLASLGAAYTFIKGARIAPLLDPLVLTFWVNALGLVMISPMMAGQFSRSLSSMGFIALSAATLFYLIAILSQFQALARLSAATTAFILNLEPVVSILMAVIILEEFLTNLQWIGVTIVISVLIFSMRMKSARPGLKQGI